MTLKATIYCAFMLVCMYSSAASVNETVFENEVAKLWCDIGVSDPRLITTWSWSNGTLIATYLMGTGFTPTDEGAMLEPYVDSTGILYINNTDSQFNGEVFRCDGFAESGAPGKECNVTLNIIDPGGQDPQQLSGGEIAGIVVGCLAFVAIIGVVVFLVVAKKGPFSRGQTQ